MRLLLALLLAGCGGGGGGADCVSNAQDGAQREQPQWVERCPAP